MFPREIILSCPLLRESQTAFHYLPRETTPNWILYHTLEDFEQDIRYPFNSLHGFTSSFADNNTEKLNTQIHFDTDSVFFVCDNSTTGHICNDIRKFIPGSLRQTNKSLTTANVTGPCLQEGTVRLHLNNDNGVNHIFMLDNCLYHSDSPVNLLSIRRLTEKFINEQGNPDKETQIDSWYLTRILTWSFGNFKKTLSKPVSGLPELLFNEGFQSYKSFCMQVSSYTVQQDTMCTSTHIQNALHTSTFIPFDGNELLQQSTEEEDDINMLLCPGKQLFSRMARALIRRSLILLLFYLMEY